MSEPKTLLQLAGADLEPAQVDSACLILIDMQNEYLDGPIAVANADAAIAQANCGKSAMQRLDKSIRARIYLRRRNEEVALL